MFFHHRMVSALTGPNRKGLMKQQKKTVFGLIPGNQAKNGMYPYLVSYFLFKNCKSGAINLL